MVKLLPTKPTTRNQTDARTDGNVTLSTSTLLASQSTELTLISFGAGQLTERASEREREIDHN